MDVIFRIFALLPILQVADPESTTAALPTARRNFIGHAGKEGEYGAGCYKLLKASASALLRPGSQLQQSWGWFPVLQQLCLASIYKHKSHVRAGRHFHFVFAANFIFNFGLYLFGR